MKTKKVLIAIIKAMRDITIIFSICLVLSIIAGLLKIYLGVWASYTFWGLLILAVIVLKVISYMDKPSKLLNDEK